jgi:NAD(P)H-hydrate epimerase
MRFVLTPAEAGELDRATQERGISADTLMEAAGREVADAALRLVGGAYGRRAVVVCGKGNNGGDGLVAARYLDREGVRTTALLLEDDAFSGPAASNLARLETTSVRRRAWSSRELERELERADVAIDAIFGTGFRGPPAGHSPRRSRSSRPPRSRSSPWTSPRGCTGRPERWRVPPSGPT